MTRLLFFILIASISISSFGQIVFNNNLLVMENEVVKQTLSFSEGRIKPVSIFSKVRNTELLAVGSSGAWFEFVVNHRIVSSDQPIWRILKHEIRKMNNGGSEIKIVVEANKEVKGLQVEIYRQFFSNSTLIRERLVLRNGGNQKLVLNKLNGKLHFIFPRYSLKCLVDADTISETRIATFDKEVINDYNPALTWDDRTPGLNLSQCHMFHPDVSQRVITTGDSFLVKGPFAVYKSPFFLWMMAYEHASQDKNYGSEFGNVIKKNIGTSGIDLQQGVIGASGIKETEDDFWFLALSGNKRSQAVDLFVEILRGGYLEGEEITVTEPYETVWTASSFFFDKVEEKPLIHRYLWEQISENNASRKSHFYYNTWGMQRDNNNKTGLRDIFTESRIIEEIHYASELNVDLFVLDDGWEETMGVWRPNQKRLPNGLAPLIAEMKKHKIIPGIWLSPMGIDSLADRYKQHPEWVLRDYRGVPVKAQWSFPAFDFVSGFYDLFLADCKKLIDDGIRFFKWDAINTFNSTLPDLQHGSNKYSKEEIRDRYGFLLPFYVTRAMRELREYNPEVVVEIDLTEKERCIIGLMPLQEGKFFWMNNGASAYNDYSALRTKSMRTVLNEYAGIIPTELFTQAVYPHQVRPFDAQRYNVNTTLVGGHGFWGNLQMMSQSQRIKAGELVAKSKRVLPYISHLPLKVEGKIGASPEIYSQINETAGAGQIIAFSGSAKNFTGLFKANTSSCLAILNHAYSFENGKIQLPFQFTKPDDTREAFIIPNKDTGFSIVSSSGWLDNVTLDTEEKKMQINTGSATTMIIRLPKIFSGVMSEGAGLSIVNSLNYDGFNYYELKTQVPGLITVSWK